MPFSGPQRFAEVARRIQKFVGTWDDAFEGR